MWSPTHGDIYSCELGNQSGGVDQESQYEGLGPATFFTGASRFHHLLNGKHTDACSDCLFIQHLCIKYSPRAGIEGKHSDDASGLERHTDQGVCT